MKLDFAQNITCQAGQVRVMFSLLHCRFLQNSLATCNRASGYVARHEFSVVVVVVDDDDDDDDIERRDLLHGD